MAMVVVVVVVVVVGVVVVVVVAVSREEELERRAGRGIWGEAAPPPEMQEETELDLGRAELLLSPSAGRWG